MASNQSDRQATVRASTGTALSYEGDWHALFTAASIPAGDFNGRLLQWINAQLGSSYTELNGAMQAFAIANSTTGAQSWQALGAFTIGGAITNGILLEDAVSFLLLEDNSSTLLMEV